MTIRAALAATLALGACAAPAGSAPETQPPSEAVEAAILAGSVTYYQRIALPPGAILRVTVEDVSLADAPSQTIAETITPIASQVPIAFEIAVDRSKVLPRRVYALRAAILYEGRLLFTTDTHLSVFGPGDPSRFEIVLAQVAGP